MKSTSIKRVITATVVLLCALMPCSTRVLAESSPEFQFTILHTNDLHSHDLSFQEQGKSIGGLPRIIDLIQDFRSKTANLVTVDAGDIFEGTPFFTRYHGATEVEMLNDGGYDIYTIGNHEFDEGPLNLAKQLQNAKFTVINCNIDASACPPLKALIHPSIIKEIAGQKVAFIGAVCPDLAIMTTRVDGVKVINSDGDWIAPIRDEVARIKQQGIDKIVLVTHVGVLRDKELAKLPDVDVIIGGHSHTRLDKEIVVDHPDGSHCVVVQTGCYGRALGKLDLSFTADGKVDLANLHYKLYDINESIPQNKTVERYLQKKAKPFAALSRQVLGTAQGDFDKNWQNYYGDSPLGNLVTDAICEGAAKYGATIAFENRGGMRAGLEKGPITEEAVQELLPFDNSLVVATITGEDLRKVLEFSVAGDASAKIILGGKFQDVHGLKFEWNPSLEPNHRVTKVLVESAEGALVPLKADAEYRWQQIVLRSLLRDLIFLVPRMLLILIRACRCSCTIT